jgi:hypothetical protein
MVENSGGLIHVNVQQEDREGDGKVNIKTEVGEAECKDEKKVGMRTMHNGGAWYWRC